MLFSTVAAPIYIPPTVLKGSLCSTFSPTFVIACVDNLLFLNINSAIQRNLKMGVMSYDIHGPWGLGTNLGRSFQNSTYDNEA